MFHQFVGDCIQCNRMTLCARAPGRPLALAVLYAPLPLPDAAYAAIDAIFTITPLHCLMLFG